MTHHVEVMTTAILALTVAVLALAFLVVVLIGTRHDSLDTTPATPLAGFTRRFLGVHIREPDTDRLTDGRGSTTQSCPSGRLRLRIP